MINKLKAINKSLKESQKHSIINYYFIIAAIMKDEEIQCNNDNSKLYLENKNNQQLIADMRKQILKLNEALSRLSNDNKTLKNENGNINLQNSELIKRNKSLEKKISEIGRNENNDSQV